MKIGTLVMQHLKAENDTNGNPRRLYVFYHWNRSEYATLISVHEEGYHGEPAIAKNKNIVKLPSVYITNREYRDIRRDAKLQKIYHY